MRCCPTCLVMPRPTHRRARVAAALLAAVMLAGGCNNAGEGAVSGAAIGALSGLAIGSLSGDAGTGAAIGAVAGAVGGGVLGDQNARRGDRSGTRSAADRPAPALTARPSDTSRPRPADVDRQALARLDGSWRLSGWDEPVRGRRIEVTGTIDGEIDRSYYVRWDIDATAGGERIGGTVTFASEPRYGITMVSRFDSSPHVNRFAGTVSGDGRVFSLDERDPPGAELAQNVTIRVLTDDEILIDVTAEESGRLLSSYRLTR